MDILFFIALGIALFIVEMLTITFYALFVSIAALVVALCLYLSMSLTLSLIIGGTWAVLCCIVFQKYFQKKGLQPAPHAPFENLVGQKGTVSESIDAQSLLGAVVIDGTVWRARANRPLAQGESIVVTQATTPQDMTIFVQKV